MSNELDWMIQDSAKVLDYWKDRLKMERSRDGRHDISITLTTLEWFLLMIEGRSIGAEKGAP